MLSNQLETGAKLYTVSQIRNIELNYAKIKNTGTYPLMEAAGSAIYCQIKKLFPNAKKFLILTGKGNNGGDGFVIARLAALDNQLVTLCNLSPQEPSDIDILELPDHLLAFQKLPANGIQYISLSKLDSTKLDDFDLIVDAMLGTGIKGAVREPFIDVIKIINQARQNNKVKVVAVDIPSGLNADTGGCLTEAIKADFTFTLVGFKQGLFTAEAANYCGKIQLFDLDIPEACFENQTPNVTAHDWQSLKHLLTPRINNAHKGDFGHCIVIGGSVGMAGAAILAATATAKCGSGLTSARLENDATNLLLTCPEVMAKNVSLEQIENAVDQLHKATSLVIGPGLGKDEWAKKWMRLLSQNQKIASIKKVWDADALNWLAGNPNYDENRILTPHPGEASRLLAITTQEVNQDRFNACRKIAQKYGGVCVLKGAGTIISNSNGQQIVCNVGNPGMASGGMGDVLSGIIGSLLAQGFDLMSAACLGVCIHGESADRVAGPLEHYRGMLASDLFKYLPELLNP